MKALLGINFSETVAKLILAADVNVRLQRDGIAEKGLLWGQLVWTLIAELILAAGV